MKDVIYSVSILLTFLLGVWNLIQTYQTTRKSRFVNTVTNQRVQWIEQLRQDISKFSGMTYTWCFSQLEGKPKEYDVLMDIDRLRHVIRLRLNPDGEADRKIERLLTEIPDLTHESRHDRLKTALDELTLTTQRLLKQEWEKVKLEAEHGNISRQEIERHVY